MKKAWKDITIALALGSVIGATTSLIGCSTIKGWLSGPAGTDLGVIIQAAETAAVFCEQEAPSFGPQGVAAAAICAIAYTWLVKAAELLAANDTVNAQIAVNQALCGANACPAAVSGGLTDPQVISVVRSAKAKMARP